MDLDLNVSSVGVYSTRAPANRQSRQVNNEQMNSTIIALHTLFHGNQEYLSSSLDQLHAAIEELKRTPEEIWNDVRSESRDVVAQMAEGVQVATNKNTVRAAEEVSENVGSSA